VKEGDDCIGQREGENRIMASARRRMYAPFASVSVSILESEPELDLGTAGFKGRFNRRGIHCIS
jgi:hypothetical protein